MTEKFLVYGGNGAQGGAVVRALLAQGAKVRLFTRSPDDCQFQRDSRVELALGDLDDVPSVKAASRGVSGIYLMLPLCYDSKKVVRWGESAIDAADEAGTRMLVFNTSGRGTGEPVGIPMLDAKLELERYLQESRVPSLTLRTTLFMGNLGAPWSAAPLFHQGVLAYPLPVDLPVSWISWEEAAAYAVAALRRPELGARKLVLQSGGAEALTGSQLAEIMSRVLDKPVRYSALPLEQLEPALNAMLGAPAGTEIARYYAYLARSGSALAVDLAPLRAELPVPQRKFEAWAREFPWALLASGKGGLGSRAGVNEDSRMGVDDSLAEAAEVVAFWKAAGPKKWFAKDADFDRRFRERFMVGHEAAARGELSDWLQTPEGALALVLLLDQFPRNAFRDTPRMYATDELGRQVADQAIARGHDHAVEEQLQVFFYLPFGHSENLADQERSIALGSRFSAEQQKFALGHRDIIRRFGRFPHRNAILGRSSTEAELAFIAEGGFAG
jgi:uncharacterized protein (DUF924 family)/uncharacterized protein YbjT (DUF2867 family)